MSKPHAKAVTEQPTFKELNLPDLRNLDAHKRRDNPQEITAGATLEEAIGLLEAHIGFNQDSVESIAKETPIGTVNIFREKLQHIVEKRVDARERYVNLALDTLENPYEVWETQYDDGTHRFMFIGVYKQRQQMLVVVTPWEGRMLWNFMHSDSKSLNKHRKGTLRHPNEKQGGAESK